MCECFACMCTPFVYSVTGDLKRALYPLELESHIIVNHHVGAGYLFWVLGKSSPPGPPFDSYTTFFSQIC